MSDPPDAAGGQRAAAAVAFWAAVPTSGAPAAGWP